MLSLSRGNYHDGFSPRVGKQHWRFPRYLANGSLEEGGVAMPARCGRCSTLDTCVVLFPKVQFNFLGRKEHPSSPMPVLAFLGVEWSWLHSIPRFQVVGVSEQRGFIMTQCCIQERHLPAFQTGPGSGSTSRYLYLTMEKVWEVVGGCSVKEAKAGHTRLPLLSCLCIFSLNERCQRRHISRRM